MKRKFGGGGEYFYGEDGVLIDFLFCLCDYKSNINYCIGKLGDKKRVYESCSTNLMRTVAGSSAEPS